MEQIKHFTRNMKRVRSDSNGDIHDGIEEELEDRYYRFTIHYIRSLMFSNIISRSMYSEMLTSGVIDKIVNKKRTGGNEIIYDTIHEEKACARYIKKQRNSELSTWTSLFSMENIKKLKHKKVPYTMLCNDLVIYIKGFL
jgi:hypothetical protein